MLKKIALLLFTYRSYERIRTEVRTLQVYGHYPCDARIYKKHQTDIQALQKQYEERNQTCF